MTLHTFIRIVTSKPRIGRVRDDCGHTYAYILATFLLYPHNTALTGVVASGICTMRGLAVYKHACVCMHTCTAQKLCV